MSSSPVQAVVLAAGKGTRMRSARAKVLHPLLGAPLIEHVLRAVEGTGAAPVVVIVGHQAGDVRAACAHRDVASVVQDPPLGTGHAVMAARTHFAAHPERTLLVVNGDLPLLRPETLQALVNGHRAADAAATLLTVTLPDAGSYGRVVRDASGAVKGVVEARDASAAERAIREINAGVYAFEVTPLLAVLDRLKPQNAQGEYYLTDVVGLLVQSGAQVAAVQASDPQEALGVNTRGELADAARRLRARRNDALMDAGVSIEDPVSTEIGFDVVVEADALIRPFTILEGRTVVRAGAQVGPFARVVDSTVGENAHILDHCLLRECTVEAGASVGPFAHIRPESVVGRDAKVGNFVELKKTTLGPGAKAPHLSYLGDAVVGAKANVGAGTITCNYDGALKHPTRIGDGAFVGSNSTLVAPISVGDGAYVAAGSVLTEDTPADALALGRSRQVVKPDWARKRRALKAAAREGR